MCNTRRLALGHIVKMLCVPVINDTFPAMNCYKPKSMKDMHLFHFVTWANKSEASSPTRCSRGVSEEDKYFEKTAIVGEFDQLGVSLIVIIRSSSYAKQSLDVVFLLLIYFWGTEAESQNEFSHLSSAVSDLLTWNRVEIMRHKTRLNQ